MKSIAIGAIVLLCLQTVGCKDTCSCKKVACPPFNDPLYDTWFPYQLGQQIIYKTVTGKADTINFGKVTKSGSYEARQGCPRAENGCVQQVNVLSTVFDSSGTSTFNINYSTVTAFTSSAISKRLEWRFNQLNINATDINAQGLLLEPGQGIQTQSLVTVNLNGNAFSNIQVLQKDTNNIKNTGPYKLYLSQNTGLVAYETYPGGELWVKQ